MATLTAGFIITPGTQEMGNQRGRDSSRGSPLLQRSGDEAYARCARLNSAYSASARATSPASRKRWISACQAFGSRRHAGTSLATAGTEAVSVRGVAVSRAGGGG